MQRPECCPDRSRGKRPDASARVRILAHLGEVEDERLGRSGAERRLADPVSEADRRPLLGCANERVPAAGGLTDDAAAIPTTNIAVANPATAKNTTNHTCKRVRHNQGIAAPSSGPQLIVALPPVGAPSYSGHFANDHSEMVNPVHHGVNTTSVRDAGNLHGRTRSGAVLCDTAESGSERPEHGPDAAARRVSRLRDYPVWSVRTARPVPKPQAKALAIHARKFAGGQSCPCSVLVGLRSAIGSTTRPHCARSCASPRGRRLIETSRGLLRWVSWPEPRAARAHMLRAPGSGRGETPSRGQTRWRSPNQFERLTPVV